MADVRQTADGSGLTVNNMTTYLFSRSSLTVVTNHAGHKLPESRIDVGEDILLPRPGGEHVPHLERGDLELLGLGPRLGGRCPEGLEDAEDEAQLVPVLVGGTGLEDGFASDGLGEHDAHPPHVHRRT
ncbi:unnamed protein product, partial [Clonostachys rosea]